MQWIIMQLFGTFVVVAFTVAFSVPLTLWALDRNGPYDRLFGVIVPANPMECGPAANYYDEVRPNGCVVVEWTIELHDNYRNCSPISSLHVSRTIKGADGITHELPRTERYFGAGKEPFSKKLRRPFILPAFSVPGPATYHSEACFICNPLQKAVNWPVCKSTPDVRYEVSAPMPTFIPSESPPSMKR
jgi:hypothetical protein